MSDGISLNGLKKHQMGKEKPTRVSHEQKHPFYYITRTIHYLIPIKSPSKIPESLGPGLLGRFKCMGFYGLQFFGPDLEFLVTLSSATFSFLIVSSSLFLCFLFHPLFMFQPVVYVFISKSFCRTCEM